MVEHVSECRRFEVDRDCIAAALEALYPSLPFQWPALWACCQRRIRRWPLPARWSSADWDDEVHAQGVASACQALGQFDPSRGHPQHRFVRWRIPSGVWNLYRHELSYSTHCAIEHNLDQFDDPCGNSYNALGQQVAHGVALRQLTGTHLRLIEGIFWDGETESAIAAAWGISQQAEASRFQALAAFACRL